MDFSALTILCVGDVMLDRFLHGDIERISPEAPVPVIRLRETREMLGGAGNVASNIAEHGCTDRAPDPFTVARTTRANWLERLFIAPYYVQYHAEHHLFIAVPCYRLPLLHALLSEQGHTKRMKLAPGYLAVLREVAPA